MEFGVFVMRNCRNYMRDVCMSVTKEKNLTARYEIWGSHWRAAEVSGILQSEAAVSSEYFRRFERCCCLLLQGQASCRRKSLELRDGFTSDRKWGNFIKYLLINSYFGWPGKECRFLYMKTYIKTYMKMCVSVCVCGCGVCVCVCGVCVCVCVCEDLLEDIHEDI